MEYLYLFLLFGLAVVLWMLWLADKSPIVDEHEDWWDES